MELPSFLQKDIAGLPLWAWGLVIVAGVGVGYLFTQQQNAAAAVPTTTPEAIPAPAGATVGTDTTQQPPSPFPLVGPSQIPYLPPGVNPLLDMNGNLIGYQQGNGTPSNIPPGPAPAPAPGPTQHGTWVVSKGDTVVSVAAKLGMTADALWQDNRYTICQAMKHHKLPCNYERGPMPSNLVLYQGTVLHY